MTVLSPAPFPSQPAAEKASLLRSAGFLPVPGALEPPLVARLAAALDRVYREEVARARTGDGEPMHLLGGCCGTDHRHVGAICAAWQRGIT